MQTSRPTAILKKPTVLVIGLLLIGGVAFFAYNYWNTHHYKGNPAERLPGIDYSPGKAEDNKAINEKKENNQIDSEPSVQTDKAVGITFAAAAQDYAQGPLVVRALLANVKDGKCTVTLKKDSQTITRTADVIQQGNYFTCDGFMIPYNEVTPGNWQVSLKVTTSAGKENVAQATATVK